MEFKSEVTTGSQLIESVLPGSATDVFNGSNHETEDDFSSNLSKLDFESMSDDDQSPSLSSARINPKSKSNPLLDQLLDKPLNNGDLGIFGYSASYSDDYPPDDQGQSLLPDKPSSLFDLCMESSSKAQSDPDVSGDEMQSECNGDGEEGDEGDEEDEDSNEDGDEDSDNAEDPEDEGDELKKEDGEEDDKTEGDDNNIKLEDKPEDREADNNDHKKSPDHIEDIKPSQETKAGSSKNDGKVNKEGQSAGGKGKGKSLKRKSKLDGNEKKTKRYMMRKNIKKIISDGDVNAETLKAQKEEAERLIRVGERAALLKQLNQKYLPQNSQDDVTILSSDDELIVPPSYSGQGRKKEFEADVIEIKSEDEFFSDDDQFPSNNSSLNSKSCFGCSDRSKKDRKRKSNEDDVQFIDTNNDGAHTNDLFNQPEEDGQVLVNYCHPDDEKPIYLAPQLSKAVKPHQIGGIRFLYDNIVDSLKKHRTSDGLGCILAHSMGLGKTLQVISFIDVYLTHTEAKHALCIVPINTLQNWMSEFDMWLPSHKIAAFRPNSTDIKYRQFDVFMLNDCKTLSTRAKEILSWRKSGGVLLIGYEMYRLLTTDGKTYRGKKVKTKDIDGLPQETYDNLMSELKEALVDPGPDLVICDEGHRIKNCNAATSLALKNIKTRRRVVLTGYPLQNNLIEYWCMVDFVRPNFLGTKQEFCNMFERPISNGQCADSTPEDKRIMKQRAHVLHKLLRGFVQRRSHSILTKSLPRKHEHVILVRMTPIQKRLMLAFLERIKSDVDNSHRMNPIMLFSVFCKIWNHPDILYKIVKEGQNFDDLDIDLGEKTKPDKKTNKKKGPNTRTNKRGGKGSLYGPLSDDEEEMFPSSKKSNKSAKSKANKNVSSSLQESDGLAINSDNEFLEVPTPTVPGQYPNRMMDYTWAEPLVANYRPGMLANGLKMLIFFEMLEQTISQGDKLLVFSHSLFTLDIIEKFLSQRSVPKSEKDLNGEGEKWFKGANYFRIDGSTSSSERERLINTFNKSSHVHLFLLSTRAGCLGINLIGANRIIVFDASWNPCHDAQAACRIYRYGQQKECYIYRLICDESLEKRIYDRQITKQEVSHRVVDELNPETNFTKREIESLIDDLDQINLSEVRSYSEEEVNGYEDDIIRHICRNMNHCLSKAPFEHESLLLDRKETKLSYAEKKQAEAMYFKQKEEMSRMTAGGVQRHSNYLASMAANLPSSSQPSQMGPNGPIPPFVPTSVNLPPTYSAKPALGRPTKYPSVGMLPPSVLKPGTYSPFANSAWNNSLSQSQNFNSLPHHQWHSPYQLGPPSSSSNLAPNQPDNSNLKFPSMLSRNSIINQYNFLPPAAFIEQLSRMGCTVKTFTNPKDFKIEPNATDREAVIIPEGQELIMIRTPQNEIYLRTRENKIFSLKMDTEKIVNYLPSESILQPTLPIRFQNQNYPSTSSSIHLPSTSTGQPELICLDDDD